MVEAVKKIFAKQVCTGDALLLRGTPSRWSRAALGGRLVELSAADASGMLTTALGLVRDSQQEGETAAWVTASGSLFFPPDAVERGCDLSSLVIVKVPREALLRAADKLARSGAFGLLVLDVASFRGRADNWMRAGELSRLLGLAQLHDIAVLFLTRKRSSAPSLGSLISLRGEARRVRVGTDRYRVEVQVLKDKRRAPGWRHTEELRGPPGLC
jgi:hypothetical protein